MFNISNYLQKFSKNIYSSENNKKQILDIIKKHTQVVLYLGDIEIKNYILHIKKSPTILNKIHINKAKILEEIALSVPNQKIVEIR
jgi:uncharacterized membrane protein